MNKYLLTGAGLILIPGLCLGAENNQTKMMKSPPQAATKMAQGTLDAINIGYTAKKVPADIALKEDNGSVIKFLVTHPSVMAVDNKHITLAQLKAGEKARVEYVINATGQNKAKSIMLMK